MPYIRAIDFCADLVPAPLRQLRKSWKKQAIISGQADPACCAPAWNLAFHKIFNPLNRIYYLAYEDSLLLFSEHINDGSSIYLAPLEDGWNFGCPLLGFFAPEAFSLALNDWRKEYGPYIPPILLSGMREDIPSQKFFLRFRKDFVFYRVDRIEEGCASLIGGVDGWLSRRSANHRAKLKKAIRKGSLAGLEFERKRPASRAEAARIYGRMLNVERRSWKGIEHCGMAESPSSEFYEELIGRQARDRAALVIFARLAGEDVGFIYGACCGPFYRGQQFSYVNDRASLSIGNLMQWEKVKWLCELGIQRYDMGPLGGERMAYKRHWTEIQKESEVWLMRQI